MARRDITLPDGRKVGTFSEKRYHVITETHLLNRVASSDSRSRAISYWRKQEHRRRWCIDIETGEVLRNPDSPTIEQLKKGQG